MTRGAPRKARNTWTAEQRTVLHLLYIDDRLDNRKRLCIFNHIFKEHLRTCGLPSGVQWNVLHSQYYERLKNGPEWIRICRIRTDDEDLSDTTRQLVRAIDSAVAASSGLENVAVHTGQDDNAINELDNVDNDGDYQVPKPIARHALAGTPSKRRARRTAGALETPPTSDKATRPRRIRTAASSSDLGVTPVTPSSDLTVTPTSASVRILYPRKHGGPLWLTPTAHEETQRPICPVHESLARLSPGELVFRYWDETSHGANSEQGFVCGQYQYNNMDPPAPPRSEAVEFADVENHVNGNKVASRFISVSNCLVETIRRAMTAAAKGAEHGKISVIDSNALSERSIYHLPPFNKQVKIKRAYTGGKWRYVGQQEFFIWHQIPAEAMVGTFAVRDLVRRCKRMPTLASTLRLEAVWQHGIGKKRAFDTLEHDGMPLTRESIDAMASFCRLIGFGGTADSEPTHLECIVAEIVRGWHLQIGRQEPAAWAHDATAFVNALCGKEPRATHERRQKIKTAFLYGVATGLGKANALHLSSRVAGMWREATRVGLESPEAIIIEEMKRTMAEVRRYGETRRARYSVASTTASTMLMDVEDGIWEVSSDYGDTGSRQNEALVV